MSRRAVAPASICPQLKGGSVVRSGTFTRMRSLLLTVATAVLVALACGRPASHWQGVSVRDSLVVLPNGRSFAPGLRKLHAHGLLDTRPRPFLVLSGFGCDDCDAVRSIYVLRFGERLNWNKKPWPPVFAYPGKVRDTENDVAARSRLFFGRCRGDSTIQVIQFAHVRGPGGRWADSIHVATVRGDSIASTSSTYSPKNVVRALQQVRRGTCTEVPGDEHQIEP